MTAVNVGDDGSGGDAAAVAVPAAAVADGSVLAGIPLFSKLTSDELSALGQLLKTRRFGAGQTVVLIGDRGTDFYVVQQGRVHVSAPDESGKEVALADLGPGNFFGEISLLDGGPRTANVRAGEAAGGATLPSLERAQFVQFLVSHPQAS